MKSAGGLVSGSEGIVPTKELPLTINPLHIGVIVDRFFVPYAWENLIAPISKSNSGAFMVMLLGNYSRSYTSSL